MTAEQLRKRPVTWGLLLVVVMALVTFFGTSWGASWKVRSALQEPGDKAARQTAGVVHRAITTHRERDVDRSHPDLGRRYVTRQEFVAIRKDLETIRQLLEEQRGRRPRR